MENFTGLDSKKSMTPDLIPRTEIGFCSSCGKNNVLVFKHNASLPICLECKSFWEPPKHLTQEKPLDQ
jgi:hypothetical protein